MKKKKLSKLAILYIEQARCPRCDYIGVYSYIQSYGCCRICAYPNGNKADLEKL